MNGSVFPVFSNTEHREKEESNAQICIYQQKEIGPKKEESAIENTGYSSKKKNQVLVTASKSWLTNILTQVSGKPMPPLVYMPPGIHVIHRYSHSQTHIIKKS